MYNNKPDDNTIEEEVLLENAWDTIGYMNLKTGTDFKPTENEIVTMEDKFEQYINVKKEVSYLLLKIFKISSFIII